MFAPIDIQDGEYENLTLWDTHDIQVKRNGNNAEIVFHPCYTGKVNIRFAKEPYACTIYFNNGKSKQISLDDESDWGEVNTDDPKNPKWGNDEDGYKKIYKVFMNDGVEIPLEEFSQDVNDFMMYFEA